MKYPTTGSTQLPAPDHRRQLSRQPLRTIGNALKILFIYGPFIPLRTWRNHGTRGSQYKVMDGFPHSI